MYEAYRRFYPVIRDANTIKLTDGSDAVTLTSTSGYPISKASDALLYETVNDQILLYNGTKWANSSLAYRTCITKKQNGTTQNATIATSYTDGVDGNIIYGSDIPVPIQASGYLFQQSSYTIQVYKIYVNTGSVADWTNVSSTNSTDFNRYNFKYSQPIKVSALNWRFQFIVHGENIQIFVYGSQTDIMADTTTIN